MPLGSAVASVFVEIGADTAGLSKGLGQADAALGASEQRLQAMGKGMQTVGGSMTRYLTLPLLAAGAAALKLSMDFDTSMSRIQGLVGLSADEVAGMRDAVLELAGETTRSPQELADALFFITSAGLRGAQALSVLEMSARASAAGLGETKTVADAVTSAMNAYGVDVLSAADATDILVATVRAGKVEAADLAPVLGRVLPVAAELGVSFADVGAAIATMTREGTGAEEAATKLTGILQKLVAPSVQGADELARMGTSAAEVRQKIADEGLLAALMDLRDRAGNDVAPAFRRLFEDGTAVSAMLTLTKNEGQDAAEIFDALADHAGALDTAFGAFAATEGFEAAQAWSQMQTALINLGTTAAPIFSTLVGGAGDLAGAFADLPGPVQGTGVALGVFVAAAGPALSAAGKMVETYGRLAAEGSKFAGVMKGGAFALGAATGLLAIGGVALLAYANDKAEAVARTEAFAAALDDEAAGLEDSVQGAIAAAIANDEFLQRYADFGATAEDVAAAIGGSESAYERVAAAARAYYEAVGLDDAGGYSRAMTEANTFTARIRDQRSALDEARSSAELNEAVMGELGLTTGEAGDQAEETADEIRDLTDAIDEYLGNVLGVEEARDQLQESFQSLHDSLVENGTAWRGNTEAARANRDAGREVVRNHAEVIQSMIENGAGQEAMQQVTQNSIAKLRAQRDQGLLTAEAFRTMARRIREVPTSLDIDTEIHGADAVIRALQRIYGAAVAAANAVGQTGGSLAGGGTYSGGGGYNGPPPGGVNGNRDNFGYGSGQAAVAAAMSAMTPSSLDFGGGPAAVSGSHGGEARQHISERPIVVTLDVDGHELGRTAALYLERAID